MKIERIMQKGMTMKKRYLFAMVMPFVMTVATVVIGYVGVFLDLIPPLPFIRSLNVTGQIFGFYAENIMGFPEALAQRILGECSIYSGCDTEAAVFQGLILVFAFAFVYYVIVGFVIGLLAEHITASVESGTKVKISYTNKKIVIVLLVILCALLAIIGWGDMLIKRS